MSDWKKSVPGYPVPDKDATFAPIDCCCRVYSVVNRHLLLINSPGTIVGKSAAPLQAQPVDSSELSNLNSPSGPADPVVTPSIKRPEVSYIRVIAALAVVQIHTVGEVLYAFNSDDPYNSHWWTGNLYYSLLRWATPFFIMLSGSIMLHPGRVETPAVFLRKRMKRVLPPFFLWSLVYLLYQYRGHIYDGRPVYWPEFWDKVLYQDVYYHLWFIPMIIGMYLLTPTFRIFIRHARRTDIEYFLIFSFTVTGLQHFIPNFFIVKYIGWMGYIGYYVLGYYLSQYTLRRKNYFYALALAMPLLTAWGTWVLSWEHHEYTNTLYVYFSPNVVIMSAALFMFLREVNWSEFALRFPRISKLVGQMAPYSFGVYFVHVLLLDVLKNGYIGGIHLSYKMFFNQAIHPIIGSFIQACIVAALSFSLIALLSKIPGMRRWLM